MARAIHKLSALRAEKETKPGRHSDGGGLYLSISGDGRRRWVLLYTWRGKLREAGLGPASKGGVSLKAAREKAAEGRALVKTGVDPIADWNRPEAAEMPTFGKAADAFLAARANEWRNEKHRAQWTMTLTRYCEAIRNKPVDSIDTESVLSVLQPLWRRAPETASRLRGRIESVLDAAKARGLIGRNEANPARWRGHLDKLLPKRAKLTRGHHAAMPYADVAAFIDGLRERPATAARALEFCILTAARSGEALAARWDEIDLDAKIWTVPPARTKASREHRIPLSDRAITVLREMETARSGEYVFPGQQRGKPLSGMAFEMLLRRIKSPYTAHGFRSSFRDWAGNETHFPRELAEHALAHVIGDKAEQAYRRSDALARRRELMDAWAKHCEGAAGDNVVTFKRPALGAAMLDAENAAILKWLVGREELPQPKYPSPGRTALVRRLRNREALADDVLNALANAFEAIGSSRMKFALVLAPRGRGRPRKNAGSIYEAHKDAAETEAAIEAQESEGRKRLRNLATGDQAEIKGKSKSKLYADRAALRRAKDVEK